MIYDDLIGAASDTPLFAALAVERPTVARLVVERAAAEHDDWLAELERTIAREARAYTRDDWEMERMLMRQIDQGREREHALEAHLQHTMHDLSEAYQRESVRKAHDSDRGLAIAFRVGAFAAGTLLGFAIVRGLGLI